MNEIKGHPLLVYVTACFLLLATWIQLIFQPESSPPPILIETGGAPTLGKTGAPTQIVIFQDPLCKDCREFYSSIFPELKEEFIDKGKVAFSAISVAALPGSKIPAEAFLAVYYQDLDRPSPNDFFAFVDYWYTNFPEGQDGASVEALVQTARELPPTINLTSLRLELKEQMWRQKVEKDTAYARVITEGSLKTPVIFADGVLLRGKNKEQLFSQIREVLRQKEKP